MEHVKDIVEPIRIIRQTRSNHRGGGGMEIPMGLRVFKLHWLLQLTAATSGMAVEKMLTQDRRVKRTAARHLYMWLAHRFTAHAYGVIGKLVLRADHTTVRHAVIRVQAIVDQNKEHMPTDSCSPEKWASAIWSVWGYDTYKPGRDTRKRQAYYMANRMKFIERSRLRRQREREERKQESA